MRSDAERRVRDVLRRDAAKFLLERLARLVAPGLAGVTRWNASHVSTGAPNGAVIGRDDSGRRFGAMSRSNDSTAP